MLRATAIERRGDAGEPLLTDVSLRLGTGERVALAGPSGAGKSVLLRALVLLDPLAAGSIEWRGRRPTGDEVPAFRRTVAYLPQRPAADERPVGEQLAEPWRLASADGRYREESARRLLDDLGRAPSFLDQSGANLSGGEVQLMALVRVLLLEPAVLLLDEPTAAMDADSRGRAERLVEGWAAADADRAWIWVSHDAEQLERLCRRRWRLAAGRLDPGGGG